MSGPERPERLELTVPAAAAGMRVDRLVAMETGLSRSAVEELVAEGAVEHNGTAVGSKSERVSEGDLLAVTLSVGGTAPPGPDPSVAVRIVHEDEDIVVVDKHAGVVVHPGPGHPGSTLVNGLLARYPEIAGVGDRDRPGIVHRLDQDTTGLMVVARSPAAYEVLVLALGRREVGREYRALVLGHPEGSSGIIDAPIGRSTRSRTSMAVRDGGREARTRYETLEVFTRPCEAALLSCALETGRTHQIRVHLAAIGLPVVGDGRYGRPSTIVADRPMLHAHRLSLVHPTSGAPLEWTSPLPPDFEEILSRMG